MGDTTTLLKELTLRVISDDYEEIELIVGEVTKLANQDGISVRREGVVRALGELTEESNALAYRYREDLQNFEVASFAPGIVGDLWFYATPQGKLAVDRWNEGGNSPRTSRS